MGPDEENPVTEVTEEAPEVTEEAPEVTEEAPEVTEEAPETSKAEVVKLRYIGPISKIQINTLKGFRSVKKGDTFSCLSDYAGRLMEKNKGTIKLFETVD